VRPHAVLAVGFAAVFYGEDKDGIAEIVEAYAVVADAEAVLWRLNVLEVLDIAYAGGEITSHDMQDEAVKKPSRKVIDRKTNRGKLGA